MVSLYYEDSNERSFSVSPGMILDYIAFDSLKNT